MQRKKEVRALLVESFKKLVLEKSVEKITIKEITDCAGVIRVTFYNHFQDKYELLEWICRSEIIDPSRILLQNNMQREAVIFIFTAIVKNKEFYSKVAWTKGQNSFESIMKGLISEAVKDYFISNGLLKSKKFSWLTAKWIADYYALSLTTLLMEWVDKGMTILPDEMVDMYAFIATHSLVDLPKEF